MAHRQFGSKRDSKEIEAPEPISFDMAYEKNILCRRKVNGKLLLELVGKVESGVVSKQSQGIIQVFTVCVRTDDGKNPDAWTGKRYDPEQPLVNHSALELEAIREDNMCVREEAEAAAEDENRRRREDAEANEDDPDSVELVEVDYDKLDLVSPGLDPTCSLARLDRVLDDPDTEIDIQELVEVVGWLVEQYTDRPTRRSTNARDGSENMNRMSRRVRRTSVQV